MSSAISILRPMWLQPLSLRTKCLSLKDYKSQTHRLRRSPQVRAQLKILPRQIHQGSHPESKYDEELLQSKKDSFEDLEPSAPQIDLTKVKYSFAFFLTFCAGAHLYLNYPTRTEEESREKDQPKVPSRIHHCDIQDQKTDRHAELEILGHSIWVTR